MAVASLDLELDVFAGPFDLLLAVVLREEISLLEVELSDVVLAYIEHLEREDELDLEVATEFLVLIASLLELKSRLLLPGAEQSAQHREAALERDGRPDVARVGVGRDDEQVADRGRQLLWVINGARSVERDLAQPRRQRGGAVQQAAPGGEALMKHRRRFAVAPVF